MTEDLLRHLHASLAVVQSQQVEINRRLANIEKDLDEADDRRIQELESAQERRINWVGEITRAVALAVILATIAWSAKQLFGVDLAF